MTAVTVFCAILFIVGVNAASVQPEAKLPETPGILLSSIELT